MKKYYKVIIVILLILIMFFIGNNTNYFVNSKLKNISLSTLNICTRFMDMKNYKKYKEENKRLTSSIINNEVIINKNKQLEEEISVLKQELELKKIYTNYDIIYSTVVNYDDFTNTFTIDKGKTFSLKKKDAVVTSDGLIGLIETVYDKNSIVKLLVNKDLNLSIKVNDSYGALSYYKDNLYEVTGISNYTNINIGDKVYTTGMGNLPSGVFIGKVEEIKQDNYNISTILIVSGADIKNVKYVAVLRSK